VKNSKSIGERIVFAISLFLFYAGHVSGHSGPYEDVNRYYFEFEKYKHITDFVRAMDAFSEEHGHLFMKQKFKRHGDIYSIEITNDVYQIVCTNLSLSIRMNCHEARLTSVGLDDIDKTDWDFINYLQAQGFEPGRH